MKIYIAQEINERRITLFLQVKKSVINGLGKTKKI